jgi:hypothetical protein
MSVFLINGFYLLSAQDTLSNGKALNFPFRKYGISIGNSYDFTGIRINFADKNVNRINGLNVTFWHKENQNNRSVINGISIGVFPNGGSMQPINLGLLSLYTSQNNLNGLSLGGTGIASEGNINGLSLSGLMIAAGGHGSNISGIAISGIGSVALNAINGLDIGGIIIISEGNINGVAIGGIAIASGGNINGFATSLAILNCSGNYKGIAITPGFMRSGELHGLVMAGYTRIKQMNGLSVALYNRTKELHGIQFGLLNYAENNRKGLRILPFINLHLKKNKNSDK